MNSQNWEIIMSAPESYYTKADLLVIANPATMFEELAAVVVGVLSRMPPSVTALCGPVSTGGAGSREKNLLRFGYAIDQLALRGENVYSQIPFEQAVKRIVGVTPYFRGAQHLLDTLYLPIFKSGFITRQAFLPDWHTSHGTKWEHQLGLTLGLEQKFIKPGFEFLSRSESLFE